MSSGSRTRVIGRISAIIRFSFREEDLPPKLRKEIGDTAQKLDYYNSIALIRDQAKSTSTSRLIVSIALVILGLITVWLVIGVLFFVLAYLAYRSYNKNKATARSKEIEASSLWSDINSQVKRLSDEVYKELSALHEARVRPTVKHIMIDFASIVEAARGKGIILDTIECPYCKGAVKIPASGEYFDCGYCGKTIYATKIFDKLKDLLNP